MQQDRNLITDAGFDGYVAKPISLKEFLEAVRIALAHRGQGTASAGAPD
jgi:DNA-binding response OmpR family regulator